MTFRLSTHTRFFFKYWIGFAGVVLLLRFFLAATEPLLPVSNEWQKSRIRGALGQFASPEFSPPSGGLVLMLGASEAELGFEPLLFDKLGARQGKSSVSYNFAFQNVGSFYPLYLDRLRIALAERSLRARVLFIDLPVSRFTIRARESFFSHAAHFDVDAALFHPAQWGSNFLSAGEKLVVSFNKWILGERSIIQVQRLASALFDVVAGKDPFGSLSVEIFRRSELHPEPAWDPATRGRFFLNIEREPELVKAMMDEAGYSKAEKEEAEYLNRCCDAYVLDLDEEYILQVSAAILALKSVADQVVLAPLPESPNLRRTPAAVARRRLALERISKLAGSELWLAEQHIPFTAADFFDLSHLRPGGVGKFTGFLAEKMWERHKR